MEFTNQQKKMGDLNKNMSSINYDINMLTNERNDILS